MAVKTTNFVSKMFTVNRESRLVLWTFLNFIKSRNSLFINILNWVGGKLFILFR